LVAIDNRRVMRKRNEMSRRDLVKSLLGEKKDTNIQTKNQFCSLPAKTEGNKELWVWE
jgi:hypothetical protein